jgi:hypothetical protein
MKTPPSRSLSRTTYLFTTLLISAALLTGSAKASPIQEQTPPAGLIQNKPTPVERFLQQYSQRHPIRLSGTEQRTTPPAQSVDAVIPGLPYGNGQAIRPQVQVCSIPLLQQKPDNSKHFSLKQVTPPAIDKPMALKPTAPSCGSRD